MKRNLILGSRIKRLREDLRLTQEEAAARIYISQAYWSRLEKGDTPSRGLTERLIEEFKLPREEWLAITGYLVSGTTRGEDLARIEEKLDRVLRLLERQQQAEPVSARFVYWPEC